MAIAFIVHASHESPAVGQREPSGVADCLSIAFLWDGTRALVLSPIPIVFGRVDGRIVDTRFVMTLSGLDRILVHSAGGMSPLTGAPVNESVFAPGFHFFRELCRWLNPW
jgi:uncharacterized membrane protein